MLITENKSKNKNKIKTTLSLHLPEVQKLWLNNNASLSLVKVGGFYKRKTAGNKNTIKLKKQK